MWPLDQIFQSTNKGVKILATDFKTFPFLLYYIIRQVLNHIAQVGNKTQKIGSSNPDLYFKFQNLLLSFPEGKGTGTCPNELHLNQNTKSRIIELT